MTGKTSGAYELNHRGKIHRASDFSQLLEWVKEHRVGAGDSFRPAGADEWVPVLSRPEFASVLNPVNQWSVTMKSGVFRAPDFETVVSWASDGRITVDAVVEGPRTPPGGVKASALPALASNLREVPEPVEKTPLLRIDGREYRAQDTATVKIWIRESRVPVESEISLDGKVWEPVSSCGLFDLEDWPHAAHGRVEEERLPEMPGTDALSDRLTRKPPIFSINELESEEDQETNDSDGENGECPDEDQEEISQDKTENADSLNGEIPFTIATAETEITVESVSELKRLLKKRLIFSYDEISHPSIEEESISVGEYLEGVRKRDNRKFVWLWSILAVAAAATVTLDLTGVVEIVPWF